MTREELLERLKALAVEDHIDAETAYSHADDALLEYIADPEIASAYRAIGNRYE